ncbi:MAG TPA: hypothetical protein DCS09_03385 [Porphyromonadaceae bacterium]|nr:hypothetical protein [Porphyromonadaceae bacterium]
MTRKQKQQYHEPEALRDILQRVLNGLKFRLDCGHHVTFGEVLGNDISVLNGKKLRIICTLCNR